MKIKNCEEADVAKWKAELKSERRETEREGLEVDWIQRARAGDGTERGPEGSGSVPGCSCTGS